MGAEDRFLVRVYRGHVEEAADLLLRQRGILTVSSASIGMWVKLMSRRRNLTGNSRHARFLLTRLNPTEII